MDELERKALALYRQYGWILPQPVRAFMWELAEHLQWNVLIGEMKK